MKKNLDNISVIIVDGEKIIVPESVKKLVDECREYKRIAEGRPPQVLLEYIQALHTKLYGLTSTNTVGDFIDKSKKSDQ